MLGTAGLDDTDVFDVTLGGGSTSSIILNGPDDYTLQLRDGGKLLASSDRPLRFRVRASVRAQYCNVNPDL